MVVQAPSLGKSPVQRDPWQAPTGFVRLFRIQTLCYVVLHGQVTHARCVCVRDTDRERGSEKESRHKRLPLPGICYVVEASWQQSRRGREGVRARARASPPNKTAHKTSTNCKNKKKRGEGKQKEKRFLYEDSRLWWTKARVRFNKIVKLLYLHLAARWETEDLYLSSDESPHIYTHKRWFSFFFKSPHCEIE